MPKGQTSRPYNREEKAARKVNRAGNRLYRKAWNDPDATDKTREAAAEASVKGKLGEAMGKLSMREYKEKLRREGGKQGRLTLGQDAASTKRERLR
jgi:hypothetical protein